MMHLDLEDPEYLPFKPMVMMVVMMVMVIFINTTIIIINIIKNTRLMSVQFLDTAIG